MATLLILLVLGILVCLVLTFLGATMGPAFNRFNPLTGSLKRMGIQTNNAVHTSDNSLPGCAKCGYPTRGITSFECPECGADLREVGIVKPNAGTTTLTKYAMPPLFTIVFGFAAASLVDVVVDQLPSTYTAQYELGLNFSSGRYGDPRFVIGISETSLNGPVNVLGQGLAINHSYQSGVKTTVVDYQTFTGTYTAEVIRIRLISEQTNTKVQKEMSFEIDPATRQATWRDRAGASHQTAGPFTDQDVLAFLKAAGADPTQPTVLQEAAELHMLMDGFAAGMNSFNLSTLSASRLSSWTNYGAPPAWFYPAYWGTCLAAWIVGLILITQSAKRRRQSVPEQNIKKH